MWLITSTTCFLKSEFETTLFWEEENRVTFLKVWDLEMIGKWAVLKVFEWCKGSWYRDRNLFKNWVWIGLNGVGMEQGRKSYLSSSSCSTWMLQRSFLVLKLLEISWEFFESLGSWGFLEDWQEDLEGWVAFLGAMILWILQNFMIEKIRDRVVFSFNIFILKIKILKIACHMVKICLEAIFLPFFYMMILLICNQHRLKTFGLNNHLEILKFIKQCLKSLFWLCYNLVGLDSKFVRWTCKPSIFSL